MKTNIIPFSEELAPEFVQLNIAWLERFFYVEKHDKEVLENCKARIIDKGGHIFFAKTNGEISGTLAFMPINNTVFELTKMAVKPKFQGQKIGQLLMEYALHFAKKQDWKSVIIYSNRKLTNALHIYRKYGFKEIPQEENTPYQRCDIKMELGL